MYRGGEQEPARTQKHMLKPHKNGLKPGSDLVVFETGAMGILQSLFAMELNIYLAQELDKLKEDAGESGACLCFMPTKWAQQTSNNAREVQIGCYFTSFFQISQENLPALARKIQWREF